MMNFSFYYFGLLLLFLVGFNFCVDPKDISSYDPEEFDLNELLNDPLVIEALESGESNVEKETSQHEPSEDEITPTLKRKRTTNLTNRIFICLGIRFKGNKKISENFNRLQPANKKNLSLGELEMKFAKQGNKLPWRELEEYPIREYRGYWAHVCDYFWVKENPDDSRYRACYVEPLLFSENAYALIKYQHIQWVSTKAEVLRCVCHYYVQLCFEAVSPLVEFSVQKFSDNEYFILRKESHFAKYNKHKVSEFWTDVMLPIPVK